MKVAITKRPNTNNIDQPKPLILIYHNSVDNQNIVHATDTAGRVVVDKIDQGGIVSVSLRKRTHNLRMVRKIIREL